MSWKIEDFVPDHRRVGRYRTYDVSHLDPSYVWMYDLDRSDLEFLMRKKSVTDKLTFEENDRLGKYIITLIGVVLSGTTYVTKDLLLKKECMDFAIMYVLDSWQNSFSADTVERPAGFMWRCCSVACARFFRSKKRSKSKEDRISEHLNSCLTDYHFEIRGGKVEYKNNEE